MSVIGDTSQVSIISEKSLAKPEICAYARMDEIIEVSPQIMKKTRRRSCTFILALINLLLTRTYK
jgi:hypothetical protein